MRIAHLVLRTLAFGFDELLELALAILEEPLDIADRVSHEVFRVVIIREARQQRLSRARVELRDWARHRGAARQGTVARRRLRARRFRPEIRAYA